MKKIYLLICVFLGFANVVNAAINSDDAVKMVKKLTSEGIEKVVNSNASTKEKQDAFRILFDQNLDLDFVGKYVLGRYWRTSTDKQREEFLALYKEFNVKTWTERFGEFKNQKIEYTGTSPASNDDQIFVKTKVAFGNSQDIDILWRVQDSNGKLKIIDIIVENVSLAQTSRSEYASFIAKSKNGIDDLIDNLKQKITN